jgi:hypothetical protein
MYALLAFLLLSVLKAQIPTDREIAAQIEQAIRDSLHPATVSVSVSRRSQVSTVIDQVEIHMSGFTVSELPFTAPAPGQVGTGGGGSPPQFRIVEAHIVCENFTVLALPVASMEVYGDEVRISKAGVEGGYLEITAAERATGALILDQAGLTALLRTQPNLPIRDPEVVLTPGECEIRGVTPWAVGIPVGVVGPLLAQDGAVFTLASPVLHVISAPIPGPVGDRVLTNINPLVDVNAALKLPVRLIITRAATAEGTLRLEGSLDFPQPR